MKASLVSATSVIALLALEGSPALAAVQFSVTNVNFGDILVGVQSSPGTATATDTGTTAVNLTWPAASGAFAPTTTATATLAAVGSTATRSYTVTPTGTGTATQNLVVKGSLGIVNASQAMTLTVTGVAPIESIVTASAGYTLVQGPTTAATVTVENTGNGSLASNGTASQKNLNGSISSVSGSSAFSGPSGSGTAFSLHDSASGSSTTSTFTYDYAPTQRGASSTSVVATFSNGKSNGTNTANSVTTVITGQGVAPVDSGFTGGNAGYVLVNNNSRAATVTISNANGDGNLSGRGSISNLNGNLSSSSGLFSGASPSSFSINDGQTATASYVFTPTQIGASSTSVTASFSNGSSDGLNNGHTDTTTISGTGVAPVQSLTVTNNGGAGSTAGTGNIGYVLVGNSGTAAINVQNTGNGNLDTSVAQSVSNLNGVVGASGVSVFQGSGAGLSLNDGHTASTTYTFVPTTRGSTSTNIVTVFSNGNSSGNNLGQTVTTALSGQGVAPVESMASGSAGYTLVGQSKVAAVTVTNSGDGNLSGLGSVSNLNGTIGGPAGSGQFSGPSPNPNPVSLTDTSTTTVNYVFAPTSRGTDSATVTGNFSNGSADGTNQAHSNSVLVTGQGVAPVQNTDTSANAGYVLVGTSKSLSYTVRNTGDGNLSGLGSISNLNGSVSSAGISGDPEFSGPSPNPTTFSLTDTSSTTVSMVFAPTVKGPSVSAAVTTNFSNGNASGNNQADAATTVLTGQGVAPVNSISTTVATARIGGGATGTGTVTLANIGNGNLATGGPDPSSNLQVSSVSGPSGGGFAGSAQGAFTLPDGTFSVASATTSTYTYSYEAAKGTARGTYTNTVVTTLANGSADGTNSAGTVNTTVQGQAVGPQYRSTWGSTHSPTSNACSTPGPGGCGEISFGSVGVSGSKTIYLDIANATADLGGDALTGLTIGDFSLTGNPDFTLAGFSDTLLHSSANGGGTLEVALHFNWSGVGVYTGDLQFFTDQEAAFGDTADGDIFDYQLYARASVPEPATWLVFGVGLGGLAAVRRRRSKK